MVKASRRPVSGVLLFDKATGLSSNQALQQIKRLYRAEKTGHTGTLDPLASGLLPLMFGEATKFAADLIDADKTYEATVRLGFVSTTGDAEGQIEPVEGADPAKLTEKEVRGVCQQFLGEVAQTPPMFSALKKDGKPLYEYARQGIELERAERTIAIHRLDVMFLKHHACGTELFTELGIEVCCSKGTYVRTLAEDLAKALGTGGYLTALRRTAIGGLHTGQALGVDQLQSMDGQFDRLDAVLKPVDSLLTSLPAMLLQLDLAKRFLHGQRLALPPAGETPGRVRVYAVQNNMTQGGQPTFLGTGNLETDGKGALLRPERLIQVTL
ncbi:tRNA pseudouridine(55) synthase TruB [Limnobacter humi]|uniref:tRNA pseudouridine synthase B n=1 Tax=Limnobacter humi TaxID=1778671 RepID=A0ABT1WFT1_9BURK|nr:tRNA pseudouridine(55) synthase TruB [Limnobacter humi]MCQ8896382.1 tRNA pseudouridine(55) synthase TruB [Limnobacter humi]